MSRVALAFLAAVATLGSFSGCVMLEKPNASGTAIGQALQPFESDGEAVIDLDQVVAGDWSRALIVCPSASVSDVSDALGFTTARANDVRRSDFLGMILFVSESQVDSYYRVGEYDARDKPFYFTPCPGSPVDLRNTHPVLVQLDRFDSSITFTYAPSVGYWFVASKRAD